MQNKETLPVGTILNSDERTYHIKSVLGQGGFGITYLATATIQVGNIPVEMQFAIKEHYISSMNEREGASVSVSNENNTEEIKESIDSFIVEAQRLNKLSLNHPGIVRVNESFRANGTAYYVMEYIKGQSLREYVKHSAQGRLSEDKALQLFKPIAETIGFLHDNKLTHLDIKPDNILIRKNGQPVVIDFGLSKHYDKKGTPTSTIKAAGCSAGYSPMEQYVGITTFTPEADIYALAATLLYMLTGKDPVVATDMKPESITNSLAGKASFSTITAITHAMEKLKEARTQSTALFLSELGDETLEETVDEANVPPSVNQTKKIENNKHSGKKKEKRIERSLYLVAFLCLGIFSYFYYFSDKDRDSLDKNSVELTTNEDSLSNLKEIYKENLEKTEKADISQSESKPEKPEKKEVTAVKTSRDINAELFQEAQDSRDWQMMRTLAKNGYRPACGALARHYVEYKGASATIEDHCRAYHWANLSSKEDKKYVIDILKKFDFPFGTDLCDNVKY